MKFRVLGVCAPLSDYPCLSVEDCHTNCFFGFIRHSQSQVFMEFGGIFPVKNIPPGSISILHWGFWAVHPSPT